MKTYRDLLNRLKILTDEQLYLEIVILDSDNQIIDNDIKIITNDNPLYSFKDTNGESYVDFEDELESEEYNCEKLLEKNYPIIKL